MEIIDAGRDYAGGNPPATITIGDKSAPNFRKDEPAYTVLGREQKAWLKERLTRLDRDLEDLGRDQRHARHADRSAEPARRADEGQMAGQGFRHLRRRRFQRRRSASAREIYDFVRDHKVPGFVDRLG